MPLTKGKQHRDHIGYFVIREQDGTAELEVQDTEQFETAGAAELWIEVHGLPGVDYWVCTPVTSSSLRRI